MRRRVHGVVAVALGALIVTACSSADGEAGPVPAPDGAGGPDVSGQTSSSAQDSASAGAPTGSGQDGEDPSAGSPPSTGPTAPDAVDPSAEPTGEQDQGVPEELADQVSVIATGFEVPWGLVPLADGTLLVGERDSARVFHVVPGSDPTLVTTVPGVVADGEGGLLGLAVPQDSAWHDGGTDVFYAYATTATDNRVLRVDPGTVAGPGRPQPSVEVVLKGIPRAGNHNGGRIVFGPRGNLFVSTGDASEGTMAQDPDSLGGKILRISPDGQPAPGNPTEGSPVYSLGHRNVQGLDWDAAGRLWASEFGQDARDEVNLIQPGENYGWPQIEGPGGEPRFTDPVVSWPTEDASPSGLAVAGDGSLYVAALRGQSLWRIPVIDRGTGTDRQSVIVGEPERLLEGTFGRLRSVAFGPQGDLWVLTSNTFRGEASRTDDQLLRINNPALL